MSTANHYKSNLRDTFFNLFEVLRIQEKVLGNGRFTALDEDGAKDALVQFERFVQNSLAPSWVEGDRTPLELDEQGNVVIPPGLHKSIRAYEEAGWAKLELPEHLGGFGAPPSVVWSAFELMSGANAAVTFYLFGSAIARVIDRLGTDAQKQRFVAPMVDRHWGAAMVLTEPDAGSDVGSARAKAKHVEGDVWEIEGVKRFITNGEFDAVENIVHLVLARPEGAGPGTKGLSMFIVPKFWVEADGSLGARNGVVCTNIEKKMGIKASSTCEMTFGDSVPARGFLVGEVHDGIRQMFHVIEHARMAVGVKSMATLSTAYLNALAYTRDRVQGADIARMGDKSAPRVPIIQHPDVRRMLVLQKCHAEGLRALALFTANVQDQIEVLGGHGKNAELDRLNDLLLPLVKGYGSEKVYELLATSLQCYGGSGYCQDYPIEQYIRDQKIDSLYEGTTHIQALDLFFRKVAKDGGQTLQALMARVQTTCDECNDVADLAQDRDAVLKALADLQGIYDAMLSKMGESIHHVGLHGNRVLFATAEAVIGGLLLRHALVAHRALQNKPSAEDEAFYRGKLLSMRFFGQQVLPNLTLSRKIIEKSSLELVQMDAAWL